MPRTDKHLATLYNRMVATQRRLDKALDEGKPAKTIAHIQTMYEQQKSEWWNARIAKIKR